MLRERQWRLLHPRIHWEIIEKKDIVYPFSNCTEQLCSNSFCLCVGNSIKLSNNTDNASQEKRH